MLDGVYSEPNWIICSIEAREQLYSVLHGLLAGRPRLQDAHVIEGAWTEANDFRRRVPWEAVQSYFEADDALYARIAESGCIGIGRARIGDVLKDEGVHLVSSAELDSLTETRNDDTIGSQGLH